MTDIGDMAANRLRRLLLSDKSALPAGFTEVVRREVERTLSGYMDLKGRVDVLIAVDESGLYRIEIRAAAEGIIACKRI